MANTINATIECFGLMDLYKELMVDEFFLSEAEEFAPEIREKLANAEEEEESPYEILRSVLKEVEKSSSLYETYISSDHYGIEDFGHETKEYYDRCRVFGLGGVYWILDNETQEEEDQWGEECERVLYVCYNDAVTEAAEQMEASCVSYLDGSSNYQEPTVYVRADVNEYKAAHDLAFRPSALPDDYCGAGLLPEKPNDQEVMRLAFHEEILANNEHDFIERLCQLQVVLSTEPEWRDRRLVVAVDDRRLPIDPRLISQRLVSAFCAYAYDESQISIRHSRSRTEPLINLELPSETPYGYEFALPVTEDRHLNALKVYLLEILQLAMDDTPNELFYRKACCEEVLKKLRTDIDRVVLFDSGKPTRLIDVTVEAEWKPSFFLTADRPFPKPDSREYEGYIQSIIDGALETCRRLEHSDSQFEVTFLLGNARLLLCPYTVILDDVFDVSRMIDDFMMHLREVGKVEPLIIKLEAWHLGEHTETTFNPTMLRYEITDTPTDFLVLTFFERVAEALSRHFSTAVRAGRSDYLDSVSVVEDSDYFDQRLRYATVKLGKNPDPEYIRELAIEVWRVLDNIASVSVESAIHQVMNMAELAGRFTYANDMAVEQAVIDMLLWDYANPKVPTRDNTLPLKPRCRRGTLARAFGIKIDSKAYDSF